jgi:hypothetical protein
MEASSPNSVPNPSEEEKTTRISVPWNKNKSQLSIPNHFVEKITTQNKTLLPIFKIVLKKDDY